MSEASALASASRAQLGRANPFRWRLKQLSFRARVLLVSAVLFAGLVAFEVHGSSMALAARTWAPDTAMQHFVASPLLRAMDPEDAERWRVPLMAKPRHVLMDHWGRDTLWSLAQFTHVPPFPVVNTNIGNGQNMLVMWWVPVSHLTTLARPMTWGYLLLGAQRGLAWAWWSQVFVCFGALYLLLELILPRRPWHAVLGAIWFCGSAYVACWSLWPAYLVGLGAAILVSVYSVLRSSRPWHIVASGAIAGLSFAGFVLQLYPPWQVPLGHTFLLLFIGLLWRDRPWTAWRHHGKVRCLGLCLALLCSGVILWSFVVSSADALHALANSEYPGNRRLVGGDCPLWRLFGGLYNAFTAEVFTEETNGSEASGFFLFLPAVLFAVTFSRRLRSGLGAIEWGLLSHSAFLTYYCVAQVPDWLASVTLMSRAQGYRAQIALGLSSIILSVRLLSLAAGLPRDRRAFATAVAVFVACAGFYFGQGVEFEANMHLFDGGPRPAWVWAVSAKADEVNTPIARKKALRMVD